MKLLFIINTKKNSNEAVLFLYTILKVKYYILNLFFSSNDKLFYVHY